MPFVVRASTQAGDSDWAFDAALDAVKKATELLGNGVKDVTVEAPDGRSYRETELTEMLAKAEASDAVRS